MSLFFTVIDIVSIENLRQTTGDTIAYVAQESLVSDFEGVLKTPPTVLLPSITGYNRVWFALYYNLL